MRSAGKLAGPPSGIGGDQRAPSQCHHHGWLPAPAAKTSILSGELATAATASAGRFGPAGRRIAGVHCDPFPRHQAGARVLRSAAKTSTLPGPEATADTPTAGMEAGPASSGAGGAQPAEVSDHRHTVLPGPVAKTSSRSRAQE